MIYQSLCNSVQLLQAETKLIYIIHLKPSLFQLHKVLLLKYADIFVIFESQSTVRDVKPGLVTFVEYADFRLVNVAILSLRVVFMLVDVLFISVCNP